MDDSAESFVDEREEVNYKLLAAYDEIILTINGNTINEDISKSKDEELGSTLFWKTRSYIRANRLNIDFADHIISRQTLFLPHFEMLAIEDHYKDALMDIYRADGREISMSKQKLDGLWKRQKH